MSSGWRSAKYAPSAYSAVSVNGSSPPSEAGLGQGAARPSTAVAGVVVTAPDTLSTRPVATAWTVCATFADGASPAGARGGRWRGLRRRQRVVDGCPPRCPRCPRPARAAGCRPPARPVTQSSVPPPGRGRPPRGRAQPAAAGRRRCAGRRGGRRARGRRQRACHVGAGVGLIGLRRRPGAPRPRDARAGARRGRARHDGGRRRCPRRCRRVRRSSRGSWRPVAAARRRWHPPPVRSLAAARRRVPGRLDGRRRRLAAPARVALMLADRGARADAGDRDRRGGRDGFRPARDERRVERPGERGRPLRERPGRGTARRAARPPRRPSGGAGTAAAGTRRRSSPRPRPRPPAAPAGPGRRPRGARSAGTAGSATRWRAIRRWSRTADRATRRGCR